MPATLKKSGIVLSGKSGGGKFLNADVICAILFILLDRDANADVSPLVVGDQL